MANGTNGVEMGLAQALQLGVEHQKSGNVSEAVSIYRKIIDVDPQNGFANYLLGGIALDSGDFDGAQSMLEIALDQMPPDAALHTNLGNAYAGLQNYSKALQHFDKAIVIDPNYTQARNYMGNALMGMKRYDEALACLNKVLESDTNNTVALNTIGNLFLIQDLPEDALEYFEKATDIDPKYAEAFYNQAVVLEKIDKSKDAEKQYNQALKLRPGYENASFNLGNLLHEQKRYEEAEKQYSTALAVNPHNAGVLNNLGITQRESGNIEAAINSWKRALSLDPTMVDSQYNLGVSKQMNEELIEAEDFFRKTLKSDPDYPNAEMNLSMNLLMQGKLAEGWEHYECRWLTAEQKEFVRKFPQPLWDGSDLDGKSILIWGEQGLGDEIRYASMISEIIDAGATVTIECDPRLVDLFARSFKGSDVHPRPYAGAETGDINFDFQCPMATLGRYLRNTVESFPAESNIFLKANEDRVAFWAQRFAEISDKPKVGIVWRSMNMTEDRAPYYATIKQLKPFLTLADVDWVNLQYDECSEELAEAQKRYGITMHDWDDINQKNDLDEVAAMQSNLDLVITCPSAVGEMSSALGVQTMEFWAETTHAVMLGTGAAIWNPSLHYYTKKPEESWNKLFKKMIAVMQEKLALRK